MGSVFVMVTAENTREMVLGAVEYEPDNYLSKPFTKDLLRARLEKLLIRKKNLKDIEKAIESRDYDLAVDLIDRKLAEKPRNENELQKLKADICLKAGLHQQAADIYERMLAVRDIPWARLGLGKLYYATREHDKAREIFQDLVDDNPRLTIAYDWLAKIQQAVGDSEAAIELLSLKHKHPKLDIHTHVSSALAGMALKSL